MEDPRVQAGEGSAQAPLPEFDHIVDAFMPTMSRKQKRDLFRRIADRATRKQVFGAWRNRRDWRREGH